MMITVKCCSTN